MRPMPREPPVTSAVRPAREKRSFMASLVCRSGRRRVTGAVAGARPPARYARPATHVGEAVGRNVGGPPSLARVAMTFDESFCACEEEAFRFLVDEHGFSRAQRTIERGDDGDGVHAVVVYRAS